MMTSFTEATFDQRWEESKQSGDMTSHWDGAEEVESCPSWLGQGQRRWFGLSWSLEIQIQNEQYRSNWSLQRNHNDQFPLTAKFYLAGCSNVQTRGIADEYVEQAGQNYLYCLPDTEEIEAYSGKERSHSVMIWLQPERLRAFGTEHIASLAPELQQFLEGDTRPFFHRPLGQTTPEMQRVLQRLLHCPYQGFTKQVYLESQALELLSLQFAQWLEQDKTTPQRLLLRSDDVERVHYAKAILAQNLMHPPSLVELARQVGLNDYKLKQGFRQVLGTTPFGCLREQRLELARQLLSDTEMSIEEVAIAVGYQSRSSFTAAFRRQFGTSPRLWQRQISRKIV
ncbi:transcriptional regulator, AraC family (plasmid) [Gloeocapsa sp. PCC 7428]|uniref:helix-turn-helix domain-containing protein n=1 Tax=Gloeocapsa sp. PCC 7428 TaxID=1173026 RepID=UPI0002A600AB|nr:AraC family transcriptional regulator [Gloeocapsa sp. PCC 7428]AFZ33322.1 transcriptional regulator, AraC family [Gloeocapsa sp. PCC 7428]